MATPKTASTKTTKKAVAPAPAPRATRAAAPQVPEAQTFVPVDDKPRGRGIGDENREDLTKGRKISIKGIDFWAEVC